MMSEWAGDKRFKVLVFAVLGLGALALAAYTYLAYMQARQFDGGMPTISVSGTSEIFVKPDVATFSFSVVAEDATAQGAQGKSAEATNAITAFLKEQGIEDRDVKTTDYNLNPRYEYEQATPCTQWSCPPGRQVLKGYTVSQTFSVKVRSIEKGGDLIAGVGERGATNIGQLLFVVDDMDAAQAEARAEAIKDAKEKAKVLADNLGVRLGRMVNYYEEQPMSPIMGYGGDEMVARAMDATPAPKLSPGENKLSAKVTLIYKIR